MSGLDRDNGYAEGRLSMRWAVRKAESLEAELRQVRARLLETEALLSCWRGRVRREDESSIAFFDRMADAFAKDYPGLTAPGRSLPYELEGCRNREAERDAWALWWNKPQRLTIEYLERYGL